MRWLGICERALTMMIERAAARVIVSRFNDLYLYGLPGGAGLTAPRVPITGREAGATVTLRKPADPEIIITTIEQVLGQTDAPAAVADLPFDDGADAVVEYEALEPASFDAAEPVAEIVSSPSMSQDRPRQIASLVSPTSRLAPNMPALSYSKVSTWNPAPGPGCPR